MELLNNIIIQCEECQNIMVIEKDCLEIEVSSYERRMEPEMIN